MPVDAVHASSVRRRVTWSCRECKRPCVTVTEESRCFCGHKLRQHTTRLNSSWAATDHSADAQPTDQPQTSNDGDPFPASQSLSQSQAQNVSMLPSQWQAQAQPQPESEPQSQAQQQASVRAQDSSETGRTPLEPALASNWNRQPSPGNATPVLLVSREFAGAGVDTARPSICTGAEPLGKGPDTLTEELLSLNVRTLEGLAVSSGEDAAGSVDEQVEMPCSAKGCCCPSFFFIMSQGSWTLRCRCKHKTVEHHAASRQCDKPKCSCTQFDSPWVCNCNHGWSSHEQSQEAGPSASLMSQAFVDTPLLRGIQH